MPKYQLAVPACAKRKRTVFFYVLTEHEYDMIETYDESVRAAIDDDGRWRTMNGIFLALVLSAFAVAAVRQVGLAGADAETMARLAKAIIEDSSQAVTLASMDDAGDVLAFKSQVGAACFNLLPGAADDPLQVIDLKLAAQGS